TTTLLCLLCSLAPAPPAPPAPLWRAAGFAPTGLTAPWWRRPNLGASPTRRFGEPPQVARPASRWPGPQCLRRARHRDDPPNDVLGCPKVWWGSVGDDCFFNHLLELFRAMEAIAALHSRARRFEASETDSSP